MIKRASQRGRVLPARHIGAAPTDRRADQRARDHTRGNQLNPARDTPLWWSRLQRWVEKSLRPPGRGSGSTCSRSGAEEVIAPITAGSSGPRAAAKSASSESAELIS